MAVYIPNIQLKSVVCLVKLTKDYFKVFIIQDF